MPALVLELIEGDTLADRIARGPVPLAETRSIAGQLIREPADRSAVRQPRRQDEIHAVNAHPERSARA